MNTYELAGRQWPIIGAVLSKEIGDYVPVLDIPQMSDERWRELAREHSVPEGLA